MGGGCFCVDSFSRCGGWIDGRCWPTGECLLWEARFREEVRANEARNRGGLKEFEEKGAYIPQCRDPFVQSQACLTHLPHSPISLNLVLLD